MKPHSPCANHVGTHHLRKPWPQKVNTILSIPPSSYQLLATASPPWQYSIFCCPASLLPHTQSFVAIRLRKPLGCYLMQVQVTEGNAQIRGCLHVLIWPRGQWCKNPAPTTHIFQVHRSSSGPLNTDTSTWALQCELLAISHSQHQ